MTFNEQRGATTVLADAARATVRHRSNGHAGPHVNGHAAAAALLSPPVDITRQLSALEPCLVAVEAEIERMISTPVKLISDIATHTLGAGGKRLRPALAILSAQICGDDSDNPAERAVKSAAAVELIHTTTLLHDDVVDGAQVRRGKPAANMVWGNETSVLVGDFLFAQVFVNAAREGFGGLLLPIATATAEMCAGELMETQWRGDLDMSEEQYFEIIALKTASLTECACFLGAMAVDANEADVQRLGQFGHDIGMAFQIVDDVFDIVSTEGCIGKPVGNDIREGDITLPMLRAMSVCDEADRATLRAIVGKTPICDEEVARAVEIIRGCDAVTYALDRAQSFVDSARAELSHFAPGPARDMLSAIAGYVVCRKK